MKPRKFLIDRPDFGIITATDAFAFPGFQLLYYSLHLSHESVLNVYDLGMDTPQLEWCRRQADINIFPGESTNPIVSRDYNMWQTFNKPTYFLASPYSRNLWIDADCLVLDDLNPLINWMERGPLLVRDQFVNQDLLCNSDYLYHKHKVKNRHNSVFINAGILGLDKQRDKQLIDEWVGLIKNAIMDNKSLEALRWWDQGAINWAIERTGMLKSICFNHKWNEPGFRPSSNATPTEFLDGWTNPNNTVIMHYAGDGKPWKGWRSASVPIQDVAANGKHSSERLRIFSLWHDDKPPAIRTRTYIQKVNLNNLDCGEFQRNHIAEVRAFLAKGLWDQGPWDYVGFLTAKMHEKYPHLLPMHELHRLPFRPKTVWICAPAPTDWGRESDAHHPGIWNLLVEIEKLTGKSVKAGPTFYGNNFICHINVMKDFIVFFRKVFDYFYAKYWYDLPFNLGKFELRKAAAYFYERIAMQYFANRQDLTLRRIDWNYSKRRMF